MTKRDTMYERLTAVHSFPDTYIFKVIGENTQDFISRVAQAVVNATGKGNEFHLITRESSAGRHVSVTLSVEAEDADAVLDTYEMLQNVQGVEFLA